MNAEQTHTSFEPFYTRSWEEIIHDIDEMQDHDPETHSASSPGYMGQILRDNLDWIMSSKTFTREQKSAAYAISACRTPQLGGVLQYCPKCQKYVSYQYCSCNNRNCPQCQFTLQKKWVMLRQSEIIPGIPYYHVVLTLPHELNDLVQANSKLLLTNLLRSSSQAVIQMCHDPKILGATPGILSALHSWSSELLLHYHVHMLVTGGGLNDDGKFVNILTLREAQAEAQGHLTDHSNQTLEQSCAYFLPLRALTDLFKGKFMDEMTDLYQKHKLIIPESIRELEDPLSWSAFCHKLHQSSWVGHIGQSFGPDKNDFERMGTYISNLAVNENRIVKYSAGLDQETVDDILKYLGRFVHASAITSNRIAEYSNSTVTFLAREKNGTGYHKAVTLDARLFIKRFLSHILPKGFSRLRCYGIFANSRKKKSLNIIFNQITGTDYKESEMKHAKGIALVQQLFPDFHVEQCPHCHGTLTPISFGKFRKWLPRGQPAENNRITSAS